MLPEPNFRVRPDEFVGRTREINIFCQDLQQGLVTDRTASFAILGDWGIGKSSLLLKLAALCSQPPFAMLPVFISVSDPAVRFYTKLYPEPFTLEETLEYARSVFGLPLDISEKVAGWLHEKTLGHPYFLACICKHLMATEKQIEADKLESTWPAILDQLGREKFRSDVSKLSAKEFELIHQLASWVKAKFQPTISAANSNENTSHGSLARAC